jgi:hypothetical protein
LKVFRLGFNPHFLKRIEKVLLLAGFRGDNVCDRTNELSSRYRFFDNRVKIYARLIEIARAVI